MRLFVALGLSLCAACSSIMQADVQGQVVDSAGEPVPDARVSLAWKDGVRTLECDGDGRYHGTLPLSSNLPAIFAADAEWTQGAIVALTEAPQTVVLGPLTRVTGRFDLSAINPLARAGRSDVGIMSVRPTRAFITVMPLRDDTFELRLPPGDYELAAWGKFKPLTLAFTVPQGAGTVDLGRLAPEPSTMYQPYGQDAPELAASEARGVPKDGALASLRGKWVLLFMFDHRMKSNWGILRDTLRLYEENADRRDRFEVVMVHHSDDVESLRELDSELQFFEKLRLPMPVVVDDDGKTFERYGIERGRMRRVPHEVLVSPDGKIEPVSQPWAAQKRLLEKLRPE